ncbi:MAG: DNA primase, partial [Chitinophagaceae bacterium]|nr:DNA primase [Chitinophagaceae bacterium]
MTVEQAKQLDMVDYLSRLGFQPSKIAGNSYWYHSPLHDEKTPSFKVNLHMNRWYDFADGAGGNLVDFGILYHKCSVSDFLQKLDGPANILHQQKPALHQPQQDKEDNAITILSTHLISSYPLQKYLHSRRINRDIADKYLKEVQYKIGDKTYYALGFKNDAGGYELRNASFKGSSSPKDITFIDNGAKDVAVFEGFFNFLSYRNMYYNQPEPARNFLVLNSTSFFEKSLPKMQEHERVHL